MRKSEKLCSLNTPRPRPHISQLLYEVIFFAHIEANCSFFAFICLSAYFLQASNRILNGATITSCSQSKISMLFSFTENIILLKWNLWQRKQSFLFISQSWFQILDYTSRLISYSLYPNFYLWKTSLFHKLKKTILVLYESLDLRIKIYSFSHRCT